MKRYIIVLFICAFFLSLSDACKETREVIVYKDNSKSDTVFISKIKIDSLISKPYGEKSIKCSWQCDDIGYNGCRINIEPSIKGLNKTLLLNKNERDFIIDGLQHGIIYNFSLYPINQTGIVTDTFNCKCFLPVTSSINDWFINNPVTAHAGGGIIDGEIIYTHTNSLEALQNSYQSGINVFELDIDFTTDSIPVCVHDWSLFKDMTGTGICNIIQYKNVKIYGKYTPMTLEDVVDFMIKHPDTFVDLDTKERNSEIWIHYLVQVLEGKKIDVKKFLKRFIIEFYSESHYNQIMCNEYGKYFNYFYSEYMNYGSDDEYIEFCIKNNIPIAGNNIKHFTKEVIEKYSMYNIKIIAYNGICNKYPDCIPVKKMGCYGIQSDFVTNKDWESIIIK